MRIEIRDDFDLKKILQSGQCFRVKEEDGGYSFITGNKVILIRRVCGPEFEKSGPEFEISETKFETSGTEFEISCDSGEWESVWRPYFDMDRDYRSIRHEMAGRNAFIDQAMEIGKGLRILRQDPWEMLLTFIISQRKSIPAIRTSVEMLAERYGTPVSVPDNVQKDSSETMPGSSPACVQKTVYCFPTAAQLRDVTEDELKACALGYRVPYIMDAVRRVDSGDLDLKALAGLNDDDLLMELQKVHGVGKKVANCISLFGYGRTSCVPVDVWISRAIEQECCGEDPFVCYGENAGIMQQYVFYYKSAVTRNGRKK